MPDLSVVFVTTPDDQSACYLTVMAAREQLLSLPHAEVEMVIVADGGSPVKWEALGIRCIRLTGSERTRSVWGSRDVGIRAVSAPLVCVADAHVVISNFSLWCQEHLRVGAQVSAPPLAAWTNELRTITHKKLNRSDLTVRSISTEPLPLEPTRVLFEGHGAVMLDREFYLKSGGYFRGHIGYGGEEQSYNLKCWMLGGSVWLIPQVRHYHSFTSGDEKARRPESDNQWLPNILQAAYVCGGKEFAESVASTYHLPLVVTELMQEERERIVSGPFGGDLNKFYQFADAEGIS